MKNLRRIDVGGDAPEDPLFDGKGHIYTGLKDSNAVVRITMATGKVERIAQPGGRPLGMEWMPDGRILLCNTELGLQTIDVETGAVEPVPVVGETLHLCNNAHVLADGTILVSDSSSKYSVDAYKKDLAENTSTGRLLKIAPDGTATVLVDGLCFANGVVYLEEQNVALVAATGTCTITKVDLATGAVSRFADTDGHPDNMSIGSDGRIWVAIPSEKNAALASVHKLPLFLRKIVANLPEGIQPKAVKCCRVQVFNTNGTVHTNHIGKHGHLPHGHRGAGTGRIGRAWQYRAECNRDLRSLSRHFGQDP